MLGTMRWTLREHLCKQHTYTQHTNVQLVTLLAHGEDTYTMYILWFRPSSLRCMEYNCNYHAQRTELQVKAAAVAAAGVARTGTARKSSRGKKK